MVATAKTKKRGPAKRGGSRKRLTPRKEKRGLGIDEVLVGPETPALAPLAERVACWFVCSVSFSQNVISGFLRQQLRPLIPFLP